MKTDADYWGYSLIPIVIFGSFTRVLAEAPSPRFGIIESTTFGEGWGDVCFRPKSITLNSSFQPLFFGMGFAYRGELNERAIQRGCSVNPFGNPTARGLAPPWNPQSRGSLTRSWPSSSGRLTSGVVLRLRRLRFVLNQSREPTLPWVSFSGL